MSKYLKTTGSAVSQPQTTSVYPQVGADSRPPAIDVIGLTKTYGGVTVLNHLDLRVAAGTVFALLGPNGAGKTTTVRILSTLIRADSGQARIDGFDVVTQRREVRSRISLTGQYAAVDDLQTGTENLRMMAALANLPRARARARADELLGQFDLTQAANRRVATYSGGLRRRLDLAAGLVSSPSVIFLDEPTTGLDPRSSRQMWQVISDLAAAGVTVFLTTQYLEEADRLADRIAIIDNGGVVAEGTAGELKQRIADQRLELTFATLSGYDDARRLLGSRTAQADPGRLLITLPTDGSAGQVRALLDELDPNRTSISHFAVHGATLDDVFLALTGKPASTENAAEETADV
jgi:ABC-2 type transport system ATP-binding protein